MIIVIKKFESENDLTFRAMLRGNPAVDVQGFGCNVATAIGDLILQLAGFDDANQASEAIDVTVVNA